MNSRRGTFLGSTRAAVSIGQVLCFLLACPVLAQQPPVAKAKAPENHTLLNRTMSGGYFVARPLKDEYDRAVERMRVLTADIDSGRKTGATELKEMGDLQGTLTDLRAQIEAKRVFVPVAHVQTETQVMKFDLGPERCLLITAEDVRIVGWDEPGVKCELEKIVISADDKPADAELAGIKLVHRHDRDKEKVGRTWAEIEADEEKFLSTAAGKQLTPEGREARRQRAEDHFLSWTHLADFQDKEIDMLDIEGLTHPQGNRQIQIEVSYDKGRTVGSEWRRHAKLTVYVPKANFVAICGGGVHNLGQIDVQHLKGSLVLATHGTHKTAANEPIQVRDLEGSLIVRQVPVDLIDGVSGDVNFVMSVELADRGTRHSGDTIAGTRQPPLECKCKNIGGNFVGWFGRVDLQLENLQGLIDVRNEFGNTTVAVAGAPYQAAHRVVSESGRIALTLSRGAWGDFPLWALTQAGTFRAQSPQTFLSDFNIGTRDADGLQRSWVGLRRTVDRGGQFDPVGFLRLAERPRLALADKDRPIGFDLISRGGTIVIETVP